MHAPAPELESIAAASRGQAPPLQPGAPGPRQSERDCPPRLSCPERSSRAIAFEPHTRLETFVPPPHSPRANAARSPDCSSSSASTVHSPQAPAVPAQSPRDPLALLHPAFHWLAKISRSRSSPRASRRSRPRAACVIFRASRAPDSQRAHIALADTASARPCPSPVMSPRDLRQAFSAESPPSDETALPPSDTGQGSCRRLPSPTTAAPAIPGLSPSPYQFPLTLCPKPHAR